MGLGLQGAYGFAAAQEGLRQRLIDQQRQQMAEQEMALRARRLANEEQQTAQSGQEHEWMMQDRRAAAAERAQANTEAEAAKGVSGLSIGQSIPPEMAMRLRGTMQDANVQNNPPLAQPPNMPDMMQPDIVPGQQPGAAWRGTDKQREGQTQRNMQADILKDPNLTPQQRLAIQTEQSGLKVPANVWEQKPSAEATHAANRDYDVSHPLPTHEPNPQPQFLRGTDGKTHAMTFVNGVAKEIPLPEGYEKLTGSEITGRASKKTGLSAVERLTQDVADADKAGLIGPLAGRWYQALAKSGTTGDPAKDALIGRLKGDILLTKMHVDAGIGGARAASSPLLLKNWEDIAMSGSRELLGGYIKSIHDDMSGGVETPGAGGGGNVERWGRDPKTGKPVKLGSQ